MIADYLNGDEIAGYVGALRDKVASGDLDEHAAKAAKAIGEDPQNGRAAVLAALPDAGPGVASSGGEHPNAPFFSRDPAVSLMQSSLEVEARRSDVVHESGLHRLEHKIVGVLEHIRNDLMPERFSTKDPEWITRIGEATLERLAQGNHPFNPHPAEYEVARDDARVVLVGDWGSGLKHARAVAGLMAEEVKEGLAARRPVHVIHLGDVYYSGIAEEVRRRVLADGLWPVTAEQARGGVTSWSLNGNHDMYGGGWGYFETLLRDERFVNQHSPDGKPTSWFRIRTPTWDLVGLDTSWDDEVLSKGLQGVLADPQAAQVGAWAGELGERKLMLLSHHQYVSAFDHGDIGPTIPHKLKGPLEANRIAAWIWGHEHRCMGFEPATGMKGVPFMRCIGHGGVPIAATAKGKPPAPGLWQIPEAGDPDGVFEEQDEKWNRFGFAVLDFAGPTATIRYRNDQGRLDLTEDLA